MIHPVSTIDENHLLYGNCIGLQYIFETPLSIATLEKAILTLGDQFPALAGRYHARSSDVVTTDTRLCLNVQSSTKSVNDVVTSNRQPKFLREPQRRDVLRGRAQLSTFTLTELQDGGTVLGIAISHLLTDAAGFHLLMQHLGNIYTAIQTGHPAPDFPFYTHLNVFEFGTERTKRESLDALKRRGLPKPIPIAGLLGRIIKSMIIKAMDKSLRDNAPVKITFSAGQIAQLKATVLAESGENWISTNAALCAHFTSIMATLSYGDDLKTEMQIGQLLDLRGRYFEEETHAQAHYVGNAILIHIDKATFPNGLQNTSRGALARYFKERQAQTTPTDIKVRLDLLNDCLRYGFTNPELDVKNPIISLNNQSKMPVYDLNFYEQIPIRIIPQDVGDNIMIFPAPDGAIDIYIRDIVNPGDQGKLLSADWQDQIFNF